MGVPDTMRFTSLPVKDILKGDVGLMCHVDAPLMARLFGPLDIGAVGLVITKFI